MVEIRNKKKSSIKLMIIPVTQEKLVDAKVNVFLKDGMKYLGCNIPARCVSEQEHWITFWNAECLIQVPRENILRIEIFFEKES